MLGGGRFGRFLSAEVAVEVCVDLGDCEGAGD